MKNRILLLLLAGSMTLMFSCTHRHYHVHKSGLPPGQAKKLTGSKSAKPFAPGQRKKVVRH